MDGTLKITAPVVKPQQPETRQLAVDVEKPEPMGMLTYDKDGTAQQQEAKNGTAQQPEAMDS